jgi:hypothetical protein
LSVSKYGLNFRRIVNSDNGLNGDASYENIDKAFNKFLSRARMVTGKRGWFENKAVWTEFNFLFIPFPPRTSAREINPKVLDFLFGKYSTTISQKVIITMDFGTNEMINQIIDITHVRQLKWSTVNFWGWDFGSKLHMEWSFLQCRGSLLVFRFLEKSYKM